MTGRGDREALRSAEALAAGEDPLTVAIDGVTRSVRMIFYARPDLTDMPDAVVEMLGDIAREQAAGAAKMHALMDRIAERKRALATPSDPGASDAT